MLCAHTGSPKSDVFPHQQHVPLIQHSDIADLTVICLLPEYISRRIIESELNPAAPSAYAGKSRGKLYRSLILVVGFAVLLCSLVVPKARPTQPALTFQSCTQPLVCYFKKSSLSCLSRNIPCLFIVPQVKIMTYR